MTLPAPIVGAEPGPRPREQPHERSDPTPRPPKPAPPRAKKEPNEITVYSHSNLFYWWPVWLCGFIVAIVTWATGAVMAVVPADSEAFPDGIAQKGSTDYTDPEYVEIQFPKRDSEGNVVKQEGNPVIEKKPYAKGEVHVIASPQDKNKPYEMPTTAGKTQEAQAPRLAAPPAASSSSSCC